MEAPDEHQEEGRNLLGLYGWVLRHRVYHWPYDIRLQGTHDAEHRSYLSVIMLFE